MSDATKRFMKDLGRVMLEYRLNEDHIHMCRDLGRDFGRWALAEFGTGQDEFWDQAAFMEQCGYHVEARKNEDTGRHEGYYQLHLMPTLAEQMSGDEPTGTHLMKL